MTFVMRKLLPILLLLLILIGVLPSVRVSATSERYYGEAYNDLTTEEHRTAYRMVEEAIAGLAPIIEFEGVVDIFYRDLMDIILAVCVDHPQYFWFLEHGVYHYEQVFEGDLVSAFEPEYILDGHVVSAGSQELADAMYAFNAKVNEIVAGIPINYTTEYEIALYLHDYLTQTVSYTLEGDHPSAYAALIHGQAACYGYSKAYQCLLNEAGIRARTITGTCPDENGELVGHAWNQIWLDGVCYYVDVTWDDFEDVNLHASFAVSLEKISVDHFADPEFILPECGHTSLDYHTLNQGSGVVMMNRDTTAAELAPHFHLDSFDDNGAVFGCEIRFDQGLLLGWLRTNGEELYELLGLSKLAQAYYYKLYDVFYLQLVDLKYKQTQPAVTSVSVNMDTVTLPGPGRQVQLKAEVQSDMIWTPDLVYTSSDESVARVNDKGLVTAVSEGSAVITAQSSDGTASDCCVVTVTTAPAHTHTMRRFEAKDPTCTQDGHTGYYLCIVCGLRFADEAASVAFSHTSEFVLQATGHVDTTWIHRFEYHQQQCKCGELLPKTKDSHNDADGDENCDTCGAHMVTPLEKVPNPVKPTSESSSGWVVPVVIIAVVLTGTVVILLIRKRRR